MPAVGDVLADRYRVDGVLGAGGMASVYRATDLRLGRQVALKVLLPNLARDPGLAERFDREARTLASVAHPNVAQVFDVVPGDPEAGREPLYVMELCEGGSLADRITASESMEPGELVPIVVAVAGGLGELHRRGLVHRDVKPANILFAGGIPKLADFGLAKSDGGGDLPTLTEPGTVIGTPAYMAAELVHGEPATTASDVYALAATTYHGLVGRAPRPTETLSALVGALAEPVAAVSTAAPRLGGAFDEPLGRALADDPAARPTLNAFTGMLVSALGASTESPSAEGTPAAPIAPVAPTATIAPLAPVPVDPAAETDRFLAPAASAREERSDRDRRRPSSVLGVLLAAAILGIAALAALQPRQGAPGGSPTIDPGPGATPTAIPTPTPEPTPPPTPTPTAAPTEAPASAALRALDEVEAAIEAARGGPDGLNGGDARELLDLADDVRGHLIAGDFGQAREVTEELADSADDVLDDDDDDDERAEALFDAIENLLNAIPD